MSRSVAYPGNFDALVKEWKEKYENEWARNGMRAALALKIANGQCARLPQALTNVGHTSRWQPGERVMDVARTLKLGTVIANFLFEYDKAWYPNSHGWHAALFAGADGFSIVTGKPSRIQLFDQWPGRPPNTRHVKAYTDEVAKQQDIHPCDNANDFFVVMVP